MYPRFLQFGSLVISSYGVLAIVAALCAVTLWASLGRRAGLDAQVLQNAGLLGVLCIVTGSRLAVAAANWRGFLEAPLLVLLTGTLASGSAALYGALLATVACAIYLLRARLPMATAAATAAPALALAAAVLDVADFAAGTHYGAPTALPWGVTYTSRFTARTAGTPLGYPLHPVQLYAAIAHFLLAMALVLLLHRGLAARQVIGAALFAEGVLQFLLAPLRGDYADAPALLHAVTQDQAIAMLMVAIGGACWLALTPERAAAHA